MASEATKLKQKESSTPWPSDPKNYQWKGTLSVSNGLWNVLAHCKPRKEDVFLRIKSTQDDDSDIDAFTEAITKLINIRHACLLTPVHAFVHKSEIWVVYPRHSGGPLIEALTSHYPNGVQDEAIVSSILYDVACGLHNLHKQQQCHRNIRASSIHIDIDEGRSLLAEFAQLKAIKWRNAANRRNTFVSPEREPFTDPLILMNDPSATWYSNDIYAFGITALQLTYGCTPPITTKTILQNRGDVSITTELYDKKCPFSKSFELLIRDCCAGLKERVSINKLIEHKFFKLRAPSGQIQQFFGHILKSTEKRINSSLQAPPLMNGLTNATNVAATASVAEEAHAQTAMKHVKHEASDANKHNQTAAPTTQLNGNVSSSHNNNGNGNGDLDEAALDPMGTPEWSFSVSLTKGQVLKLAASDSVSTTPHTPTPQPQDVAPPLDETLPPMNGGGGPSLHNTIPSNGPSYNDPSNQHKLPQMNTNNNNNNEEKVDGLPALKSKRMYRVSYSESEQTPRGDQSVDATTCEPMKINRFVVEYDSRKSESGGVSGAPMESSLTDEHTEHSDEDEEDMEEAITETDAQGTGAAENTKVINRFVISTVAKNSSSGDSNQPPPPQQQPPQQVEQKQNQNPQNVEQTTTTATTATTSPQNEWIAPSTEKAKWTKEECSEWVVSLGDAYVKYKAEFISNGIDGHFMAELDDELLTEVIPSKLHRRKIISAWENIHT